VTGQAYVPWRRLKFDVGLVVVAVAVVLVSFFVDVCMAHHDYFQRSGAVMVLISGYLAYRGLDKCWVKAENSFVRGYWLRTSKNQRLIDSSALVLSLCGTAIWGYGDKLFSLLTAGNT
jgi:hypothetical protein